LKKRKLVDSYPAPIDPTKIHWVDPDLIRYQSNPYFDQTEMAGAVLGGNWDADPISFDETPVYQSLYDRFVNGSAWHDTILYKVIDSKFVNNPDDTNWGCDSIDEFEGRLRELDELYESIDREGYKSQAELSESTIEDPISFRPEAEHKRQLDEVTVNIGRHGELFCNHGRHRLSIAKILDVDSIPVRVVVRHQVWQDFRDELTLKIQSGRGATYNRIPHIDFDHIDSQHSSDDRWDCIRSHLERETGVVLDIGSNWGYFCHQFEEVGFECIAVEREASNVEMIQRFRDAHEREFTVINEDIFAVDVELLDYDVVLALNIFHHFLKTEELYDKLVSLLEILDAKVMFFQSHAPGEEQMEGAYRTVVGDEFADLIVDASPTFDSWEFIGMPEDNGRRMYKIESS
jgi:hypothetical protein